MAQAPSDPFAVRFFTPNQLLLFCDHQPDLGDAQLRSGLQGLDGLTNNTAISNALSSNETSSIATLVRAQSTRRFSLVTLTLADTTDSELVSLVEAINNEYNSLPEDGGVDTWLDSLEGSNAALTLRAAALNFLMSSAPSQVGAGGPGSVPTAAPNATLNQASFTLPNGIPQHTGSGTHLYVLDSAHSLTTCQSIYSQYVQSGSNGLLPQLMTAAPSGTNDSFICGSNFRVARNPLLRTLEGNPNPYSTFPPYDSSDHGLFIAGILRTLVSAAPITLIEVLNKYGIGTLESITEGFATVLLDLSSNGSTTISAMSEPHATAILNCSFMLATPQNDYAAGNPHLSSCGAWQNWDNVFSNAPSLLNVPGIMLQIITALVQEQNASIVAAAGNEGHNGNHPPARYPAALHNVVGVAASKADNSMTPYSNLADSPPSDGFQVIGGMIRHLTSSKWVSHCSNSSSVDIANNDPNQGELGLLGIFTRPFPNPNGADTPNSNGWGFWAGTSFAAPIVAALLARLRGQGMSHSAAVAALRALTLNPNSSDAGKLQVTQG
ncbi:MAG: S8/S53 family peptidase [Anaerolineales bacterium]|nr:S8/S53 family peptidase [Anaerolineales bacterium]